MVQDAVNAWATLRFALGYPDERHLALFRELFDSVPSSLRELQSLYIGLFEAGHPQPKVPLTESFYRINRPAGEVVLENKLFYQHFGLSTKSSTPPDHLLVQLEFLSWLEHCIEAGNPDRESLERARHEFIERHLRDWLPSVAHQLRAAKVPCYAAVFAMAEQQV